MGEPLEIPADLEVASLAYLQGASLGALLAAEKRATEYALVESRRPNYTITLPTLEAHSIVTIDLVVSNLYPFEETVATPGASYADIVEKIDIGGPSMLRSAAKNHADVGVVVCPADYPEILAELREQGGLTEATRRRLALDAFRRTAAFITVPPSQKVGRSPKWSTCK